MKTNRLTPKPVEFTFDYISKGFELFKANMGTFILCFLATIVMCIIPFCAFVGIGNFLKVCRKLNRGEQASAGDIFDFSDFNKFIGLYVIFIAIILIQQIPNLLINLTGNSMVYLGLILSIVLSVVFVYIMIKAFYLVAIMALENVDSFIEAWNMSKIMTKGNMLVIFGFSIVVGIIGQLGFIACIVGVFFTLPLAYVINYVAYEHGLDQIKQNDTPVVESL